MKTYNNLFNKIISFENLHKSYIKARKGKKFNNDVLNFSANLEQNLIKLHYLLKNQTYSTGKYKVFIINEPKTRVIASLPFEDRVIQHALCNIIEPIWEKRFINDSYACRKNYGTHAGVNKTVKYLRYINRSYKNVYILKMDIKSYFQNINHEILYNLLSKHISCDKTLFLIKDIIKSWSFNKKNCGLPIGNLTSQLFANIYLHQLDIYSKQQLHLKYYIRYMDDIVIIHHDKKFLHAIKNKIKIFLMVNLHLELNNKTSIFPIAHGVDFLGYRIWPTHKLLRKSSVKRMRRKIKKFKNVYKKCDNTIIINQCIQSWLGHAMHANTYKLRKKLFNDFVLTKGDCNYG